VARLYKDYINVDKDFIPVFNKHWDKEQPQRWKSFYPHESFKSILSQLADTLEMSSNEKRKSIWISGAYGTGKTFASFAIKHILEEDIDNTKGYFDEHNMLSLYSRFAGIKSKGDILVVHRSGSAGINGDNRLFNAIQESIKSALKEKGYKYLGAKSQYDVIMEKLKDPNGAFNFAGVFNKYKGKFTDYSSPDSVIKDLEELDLDGRLEVLETIMEVAEKENYIWSLSADDIINWIEDIIKGNKLYSIVFIWDEFTEFFKNNPNRITGLQELAHSSSTKPFFLFLITHSNSAILIHDSNQRRIIEARFKSATIEMADTTAFMLMKQAIKPNLDLKNEWESEKLDLWSRIEKTASSTVIKYSDDIKVDELRSLLPLHPYAAYLLKVISASISSNQRTMFQFLSGDTINGDQLRTNFRWFIESFSNEQNKWNYLTANYIWDYFFTFDNVDLDETSKSMISHYSTFENICSNEEEKKVLKAVLLLTAMQQKSGGSRGRGISNLLRPTLMNISSCFNGTPISSSVNSIMANFVHKGIFGEINEGNNDKLFVTQSKSINQERFDSLRQEVLQAISFEKLINNTEYSIFERYIPSGFLKARFELVAVTPNDYKSPVDRAMSANVPHSKIPLIYIFAKNEADKVKVNSVIEKIYNDCSRETVIVDFSGQVLTDDTFNSFIDLKTKEKYFSDDTNQTNLCRKNAKNLIDEWKNKIDVTTINVYSSKTSVSSCQGGASLRARLKDINYGIFSSGLESITENDKVFAEMGYKETVAAMGMCKLSIPPNYNYLNTISSKLTADHVWNVIGYEKNNPSHSVSQMKIAVEQIIEDSFKKNSMVGIKDIWSILQKKPFGLLSCTGAVFLLGFLLKDYANSNYYKFDKINTVDLTHDGLADLIYGVVKGLPKSESQFIVKTTPEQVEFCKITGKIFKIAVDKQNSVSDIAKNIKSFLTNNEYPLWPLANYIEQNEDKGLKNTAIKIVELYCEFVSSEKMAGRDETKIAEEIYILYKKEAGTDEYLESIMQVQNLKSGLQLYMAEKNPALIKLARELNLPPEDYLKSLKDKITDAGSYLWNKGDINKQIDNVYEELQFINNLNKLLSEKKKTVKDATEAIVTKLSLVKLPYSIIRDSFSYLDNLFKLLMSLKNKTVNKAEIIKEIVLHGDDFNSFYDGQFGALSVIIQNKLGVNLTQDELETVYNKIESDTLYKQTDLFFQTINQELDKYKKNKKINLLLNKWKEKTGTSSPLEWSGENELPILCLFANDIVKAQNVFGIINRTRFSLGEDDIDEAISYLDSDIIQVLSNISECNEIFRIYFAGDYEYIIRNAAELRSLIKQKVGGNPYDWFAEKEKISRAVMDYSAQKYSAEYYNKVLAKVDNLSPERAKEYLKVLIKDKPIIGINILKD
jgi:hypothetical protein